MTLPLGLAFLLAVRAFAEAACGCFARIAVSPNRAGEVAASFVQPNCSEGAVKDILVAF